MGVSITKQLYCCCGNIVIVVQKFHKVYSDEETVEFKNINVVLPGGRVVLPDFNFSLKYSL